MEIQTVEEKILSEISQEELTQEQQKIELFKKENNLPAAYGTVQETDKDYIVIKRIDLTPWIALPFRGVDFILALDPSTKLIYIHSIHYPKSEYKRDYVEKMAYLTTSCRYCVKGSNLVPLQNLDDYFKQFRVLNIEASGHMFNFKDFLNAPVTMQQLLYGKGISLLWAWASDAVFATELGRRLMKGIPGALSIAASAVIKIRYPRVPKKTSDLMMLTGMDLLSYAIDPTPQQISDVKADWKRLTNTWMGYGPSKALKGLFKPVSKLGGPASGPRELIPFDVSTSESGLTRRINKPVQLANQSTVRTTSALSRRANRDS